MLRSGGERVRRGGNGDSDEHSSSRNLAMESRRDSGLRGSRD